MEKEPNMRPAGKTRRSGRTGIRTAACLVSACALSLALSIGAPLFGSEEGGGEPDPVAALPLQTRLALFKAQEKRDRGEYLESAKILVDFVRKHPQDDHCLVQYSIATSLVNAGKPEEALDHYQAAAERDSSFAQAWMKLGETAYNLGSYRIASKAFMRGYALDSRKMPQLLYYAGAAYYLGDQTETAIPILEDLVSGRHGEPKFEWFRMLLAACRDSNYAETGRRAAGRMMEIFGDDPEAWRLAFQYFASARNYLESAAALTVMSYMKPLSRDEERTLGDLYNAIGVPALASARYESALDESGGPQDYERLASAYLAAYDFKASLETITRALDKHPTGRLWSLLGDLHLMQQNHERAYDAYSKCVELDPERGRTYLMMGYCAYELGRRDDAVAHLERAAGFPEQEKTALDLLSRIKLAKR